MRRDDTGTAAAWTAWLRDLRVLLVGLLIAAPGIWLLPVVFPARDADDGQRLLDALAFGLILIGALAVARWIVDGIDRRRQPRGES